MNDAESQEEQFTRRWKKKTLLALIKESLIGQINSFQCKSGQKLYGAYLGTDMKVYMLDPNRARLMDRLCFHNGFAGRKDVLMAINSL